MARIQEWILEDVDPVYGSQEGRISYCGEAYRREEYVDMSDQKQGRSKLHEPNLRGCWSEIPGLIELYLLLRLKWRPIIRCLINILLKVF